MRSIVSFRQTSSDHRAALVEQATEVRLTTEEGSTLSERHARLDEHGNYTYPYEPILCSGPLFPGPNLEQPHSEKGVVSLPKRSSGYRLRVDVNSLFGSQLPTCGGGADIALHANEGADRGVAELPAPKLNFFRLASEGDKKSRNFEAPRVSISHGGVSGFHTFENQRRATVQISWFPETRLKAEGNRLRDLKCGPQFCDQDSWGS